MPSSFDKLLDNARRGDRVAMGRLLMLHDRRLRQRISRKIGADLQGVLSADDVLQEAYTEAHRHIGRFNSQGPQAFYNWLARIADHRFLDAVKALRAAKRSPRRSARRVAVDRSSSFLGLAQLIDEKNRTPSKVIAGQEAVQAMQVALASLPEPCRRAVWMRHIEGKSVKEIAAVMGRSVRAVHQLCYRGMLRLREQMVSQSGFRPSGGHASM